MSGDGGAISQVDDLGGHHMDSGIHRHQFRFLRILFRPQIRPQHLSGAAELPRHRQRHGEGVGLVLGARAHVFPALGGYVHGGDHGVHWLRSPVARY